MIYQNFNDSILTLTGFDALHLSEGAFQSFNVRVNFLYHG